MNSEILNIPLLTQMMAGLSPDMEGVEGGDRCAIAFRTQGSHLSPCVTTASSPSWREEEKVERSVAWLTIFVYRLTHNQCFRCFFQNATFNITRAL